MTREVAEFIVNTRYQDIPPEVIDLGKKSILDGLGLALSGSVAETGPLTRTYLKSLGFAGGGATVLGSSMKAPVRFAAFANGVAIHADDYDDTQLAVAKDRVYGLLTHPTAPALPAGLALAEARRRCRARNCCWPITWASRWNARSPRRSRRGTTTRASTPPARAARSARRRRGQAGRPRSRDNAACAWGSPAARRRACAKTSAR